MKKTRKQIILDNDLSIPAIMAELETYKTGKQKAKFLREMGKPCTMSRRYKILACL